MRRKKAKAAERPLTRSEIMARIGAKDTKPELALRRALHAAGLRFRKNRKGLPGSPDVVLPSRRLAIFVHGCFWHGHACGKAHIPKTNRDYWEAKIQANKVRDRRTEARLRRLGWRVWTVWECAIGKGASIRVADRARAAAKTE